MDFSLLTPLAAFWRTTRVFFEKGIGTCREAYKLATAVQKFLPDDESREREERHGGLTPHAATVHWPDRGSDGRILAADYFAPLAWLILPLAIAAALAAICWGSRPLVLGIVSLGFSVCMPRG